MSKKSKMPKAEIAPAASHFAVIDSVGGAYKTACVFHEASRKLRQESPELAAVMDALVDVSFPLRFAKVIRELACIDAPSTMLTMGRLLLAADAANIKPLEIAQVLEQAPSSAHFPRYQGPGPGVQRVGFGHPKVTVDPSRGRGEVPSRGERK